MLTGNTNSEYSDDDKDHGEDDGDLKQRFLYPSLGAVRARLGAEDASQSAPPHLEHDGSNQDYSYDDLSDIEIAQHG